MQHFSKRGRGAGYGQVVLVVDETKLLDQNGCQVRVLADRSIGCSPKLMWVVLAWGWTFLFRVTKQGKLILTDSSNLTFYDQVQPPSQSYAASGTVFKKTRSHAQHMWIEEAFRDLKLHGCDCEDSALGQPQRIESLGILLMAAYAWMLLVGITLEQLGYTQPRESRKDGSYARFISLFCEGHQACLAALFPWYRPLFGKGGSDGTEFVLS